MPGRPKHPRDFWSSITASRLSDLNLLSPPSDACTEDVRRQALDDEIAAMSVAFSGLKERRNFLYCKPKFPPEVLEYIFAYVALEEIPGQVRTETKRDLESYDGLKPIRRTTESTIFEAESRIYEILGWVKLTHVCRAWRSIALADGNRWLWSTMDTGRLSAEGMHEILDRSHPHPITSKVNLSVLPNELEVFAILLEPRYLYRLRSLRIARDDRTHPEHIELGLRMIDRLNDIVRMLAHSSLSHPGLRIESLAVAYDDDLNFAFPLSRRLLAPHLRHLTLNNVQLSLDEDIVTYPQLTHLDITVDLRKAAGRVDHIDGFVEFLRGSPNLQVLRVIGSIPKMDHVAIAGEVNMDVLCVDLLHLEELRLDGTDRDCALFGQYLNIPDSCSITINALPGLTTADPPYDILGSILRRWAQSPVRLDILSGYPVIRISMWNTSTGANIDGSGESKTTPFVDKPPRLHLMANRSLSVKKLAELHVHTGEASIQSPQWWSKLFPDAKTVQRVSVVGAPVVNGLISALNPSLSHWFGQQRDQPLFPDLKTLCLRHWNPATLMEDHNLRRCLQVRRDDGLGTVMNIEFAFSDGTQPGADFEASLAELEGLATFHIKVDQ
ncbi:hypothetical protein EWM64_g8714 [Hericium alpestre]|uniref:Uncharacterized protein n=1 Tax=Hericium alpestre TaxID=135208 RepID=A0A4Y9ZP50_9AGAM|nr:hypothetical protein EWM64_g8714 [Hericium alpestre]